VSRKQQHVELAVGEDVQFRAVTTGFERYRFTHCALPEISLEDITTSTTFFNKTLRAPLIISSMTGGYGNALTINESLARIAAEFGLAIGVGSARQAMENSEYHETFRIVRKTAPHAFVFTNIGAVEIGRLARTSSVGELQKIIDLIEADALAIHLNPLQELLQPEGEKDFRDVLRGIESAVKILNVPIIVKEVGAGISRSVAERLLDVGVKGIDVAGAGGTSWAGVEILRNNKMLRGTLEPFWDWGIPTAEAVTEVASLRDGYSFSLIASGGITNGVEIAKSITLGADLAAIARPLLMALIKGGEAGLRTFIQHILFQICGVMFLTGSRTIADLASQNLRRSV
jgi:isopentenyl-diphosphate delta-isomerase